eukprot:CAMPEP_0113580152 /NCGR_PEP_ID=MMETSP0015_2-20120614/30499_1 /TAXON_ID=2838 /ORGANISM="Odontella" /LENGTH=42 /DNA_ID=CAMNT_0000484279 /DNA_START=64 /DNA_END=188 /DNA_ORIENTATION=+ /assembly_acc=CAM_ASM_000160
MPSRALATAILAGNALGGASAFVVTPKFAANRNAAGAAAAAA